MSNTQLTRTERSGGVFLVGLRRLFIPETPQYTVLVYTTIFLLGFGLVMVFSASSIESRLSEGNFFSRVNRQALLAVVGVPLMLVLSRFPASFWRSLALPAILVAMLLQFLVVATGLGFGSYNTNWLRIGAINFQPSEFIKLALIIWLAKALTSPNAGRDNGKPVLRSVAVIGGGSLGLVMLGNDLGTAVILAAMILAGLFFAGVRLRIIGALTVLGALAAFVGVNMSTSRSARFSAWLNGCADPVLAGGDCYQTLHGWQALANGGVVGVGLGNSSAKWHWLPEAETDFIFAIIGEELGLIGAGTLIILFVVLAVVLIVIMRMQREAFARVAVSVATVWIIGQAFINIAVVLGLLPVLGVPLPLVSAGGSSLITTLAAIGIVLAFARMRPATASLAQELSL